MSLLLWGAEERIAIKNDPFHPLSPLVICIAFVIFELIVAMIKVARNKQFSTRDSPLFNDSTFKRLYKWHSNSVGLFIIVYFFTQQQLLELILMKRQEIHSVTSLSEVNPSSSEIDYYQVDLLTPDSEVLSRVTQHIAKSGRFYKGVDVEITAAVRLQNTKSDRLHYLVQRSTQRYPKRYQLFSTAELKTAQRPLEARVKSELNEDHYLACVYLTGTHQTQDYLSIIKPHLLSEEPERDLSKTPPLFFKRADTITCSGSGERLYRWQYIIIQIFEILLLMWLIKSRDQLQREGDRVIAYQDLEGGV